MKSLKVKFVGNPEDHTGYGRACLYTLEAMRSAKIKFTLHTVNFLPGPIKMPDYLEAAKNSSLNYDFVITELTPDNFTRNYERDKYNIGYFFWETDKIPEIWTKHCNRMDEVWVSCESNKRACIKGGVTVPIRIIPQATNFTKPHGKLWIPGATNETYIFYSIFQWTPRKNPECLINSYLRAFNSKDNTILVLKTYAARDSVPEIEMIKKIIRQAKITIAKELKVLVSDLPKIYYLSKIISDEQIYKLHNTGHCFVTAARGEGWNVPGTIALLSGQPIISPGSGGVVDMMDTSEYYNVPCNKMVPVTGMPRIVWYNADQNWCDPSAEHMKNRMREVFDKQIKHVDYRKDLLESVTIKGVGRTIRSDLVKLLHKTKKAG